MAEQKENKEANVNEVKKRLKRLNKYIQGMKDSDEKLASIGFCIANLIAENCGEIEGLGLLEKIKSLLGEANKAPSQPSRVAKLPYIS